MTSASSHRRNKRRDCVCVLRLLYSLKLTRTVTYLIKQASTHTGKPTTPTPTYLSQSRPRSREDLCAYLWAILFSETASSLASYLHPATRAKGLISFTILTVLPTIPSISFVVRRSVSLPPGFGGQQWEQRSLVFGCCREASTRILKRLVLFRCFLQILWRGGTSRGL